MEKSNVCVYTDQYFFLITQQNFNDNFIIEKLYI